MDEIIDKEAFLVLTLCNTVISENYYSVGIDVELDIDNRWILKFDNESEESFEINGDGDIFYKAQALSFEGQKFNRIAHLSDDQQKFIGSHENKEFIINKLRELNQYLTKIIQLNEQNQDLDKRMESLFQDGSNVVSDSAVFITKKMNKMGGGVLSVYNPCRKYFIEPDGSDRVFIVARS